MGVSAAGARRVPSRRPSGCALPGGTERCCPAPSLSRLLRRTGTAKHRTVTSLFLPPLRCRIPRGQVSRQTPAQDSYHDKGREHPEEGENRVSRVLLPPSGCSRCVNSASVGDGGALGGWRWMRRAFISGDQMVVERKTDKEATWILAEEITVFRVLI